MQRSEATIGQLVEADNGAKVVRGNITKLNPAKAIVEGDGKRYSVPYDLLTAVEQRPPAGWEKPTASVTPYPAAREGDIIAITQGRSIGDRFLVSKVNSTRYVGTNHQGVSMTIPHGIAHVVLTAAERVTAKRKALVLLGISEADVLEWEKTYL